MRCAALVALSVVLATGALAEPLEAVVTRRVVHPGQVLAPGDLRVVAVRNPAPVRRPVVRAMGEAVGRVARRTLLPRRYIPRAALRKPHAVEAGARVSLRYRRGALVITLPGTALAAAGLHEPIVARVRGGRKVFGTVAAAGVVEVQP